jgi:hypothetical protein
MTITTANLSEAQVHLPYLLEETASSHQPITIVGTVHQVIVDWSSLTLTPIYTYSSYLYTYSNLHLLLYYLKFPAFER